MFVCFNPLIPTKSHSFDPKNADRFALTAGRPQPQLSWFRNGRPVEAEASSDPITGQVTSVLRIATLTREHLHTRLQCSAENSNVTQPAIAELLIDLNCEYSTYNVIPPTI